MKRRTFAFVLGLVGLSAASPWTFATAQRHMRVLVLGGTSFLGPAIVNRLKARGHTVILFNRGLTNPHLFPALELIRGDRDAPGGLAALGARETGTRSSMSGLLSRECSRLRLACCRDVPPVTFTFHQSPPTRTQVSS